MAFLLLPLKSSSPCINSSSTQLFIWGTTLVKRRIPDWSTEPYPPTKTKNRLGTQRSCSRPLHYIFLAFAQPVILDVSQVGRKLIVVVIQCRMPKNKQIVCVNIIEFKMKVCAATLFASLNALKGSTVWARIPNIQIPNPFEFLTLWRSVFKWSTIWKPTIWNLNYG